MAIGIDDVVKLLDLKISKNGQTYPSYYVQCPFCGDKKYHMNINSEKEVYHCFRCGSGVKGTTYLDLYSRVRYGVPAADNAMSNTELYFDLKKEIEGGSGFDLNKVNAAPVKRAEKILPADDSALHVAYNCLLQFPELKLSALHREKLKNRGLTNDAIEQNGYRSYPDSYVWIERYKSQIKTYRSEKILEIQRDISKIKRLSKKDLLTQFIIGDWVAQQVSVENVPGFYKVGGRWAVNLSKGMLIPSRNMEGEIVGIQTRTDNGNSRYLTLSSSAMPGGVNTNISRAHFPLANSEIGPETSVLITEGPLKSDVARSFYKEWENVAFVAILGVHNMKDIEKNVLPALKERGVRTIINAFDMDKLTNIYVNKGCRELKKLVHAAGMQYKNMYWDLETAYQRIQELYDKAVDLNLDVGDVDIQDNPPIEKTAKTLFQLAELLTKNDYECREWTGYKGIDDYLYKKSLED